MSNSRSTKTISAETSAVVASAVLLHWQGIFATFLKDASAALSRPHFYLIQANGWQSLGLLAGILTSIYSQLLLKCKLVFIRTMSDGSKDVRDVGGYAPGIVGCRFHVGPEGRIRHRHLRAVRDQHELRISVS
jgi:hypothetical protein